MVGTAFSPLYVAEISANHLGSLERAKTLVEAAKQAGATAVKFQTYTADTMTLNLDKFAVGRDHQLWGGLKLYDLYDQAKTPWEWHEELFQLARSLGLIPFSSPFDITAVKFLEILDCPIYKIASLETGDHELIRAVAQTGKPLIVSTGATEFEEIAELVDVVRSTGNMDLTLLVCTSSYPAIASDSHISRIKTLREQFNCKVGISDHTLGIGVSVAAIALGAVVVEKHLTINRSDGGADAAFSMEPSEFANLVREGDLAFQAIGEPTWKLQASESESRRLRRSLYIVENVEKGDLITNQNLRSIRPGDGCKPKHLESLLGKHFTDHFEAGTPMKIEFSR